MRAAVITRRVLVAGAALAGMGMPMTAEAEIGASTPDAGLFDLIQRHGEAEAAIERATVVSDDLWWIAQGAYPPRPDALLWRPGDFPRTSFGKALADRDEDGQPWRYGARAAEWLRDREPFPAWAARMDAAMTPAEVEAAEARRLEIVTAWDAHSAERRAVHDRVGYTTAAAAEDEMADLVVTLAIEIKRTTPRTLPGLRTLAAWVAGQAEAGAAHDDLLLLLAGTVAGFGGEAL